MKELIIIGCGPGGYDTATFAAKRGFHVTIFEKGELGGTCLNRGCIPTKVYCHVASALLENKKIEDIGIISAPGITEVRFGTLKAHKDTIVEKLKQGIETLMSAPGITLIRGEARLKDAHTVVCTSKDANTGETATKDYTADYIIIATGSHSAIPPIEGINNPCVVTSTGLLNMDSLPHRLTIIGAGVIGMEMASAYSAFGSEVTVIEFLKECLPPMDQDLAKRLRKMLEKRGVKFYLGASAKRIIGNKEESEESKNDMGNSSASVVFEQKGKELSIEADTVLVATGRRPNVEGHGLEEAGIAFDRHGITVDNNFETSLKGVYAIGDVNGKVMLAHAAEAQGHQVIEAILNSESSSQNSKSPVLSSMPSAVFTIPELAGVGPTEAQLKAEGRAFEVHKSFYRANGKAVAMDATDGLVKIISDDNGRIISCHVLGAHAADLVQEATVLIDLGATMEQLSHIVHIHPTLGELLKPE